MGKEERTTIDAAGPTLLLLSSQIPTPPLLEENWCTQNTGLM